MPRTSMLLLASFLILTTGCIKKKDQNAELLALVEAERAFAKMSVSKGMREAFLSFLSDEAVVFRPTAVNGKQWYQQRPPSPGRLSWEPIFADIAGAGDMGYTTGPWEFRKDSTDAEAVAFGHYVSVWKKQADGSWRVVIDVGNVHERPTAASTVTFPMVKTGPIKPGFNIEAERAALLAADRSFAESSSAKGFVEAFMESANEDVRFYRMNAFPVVGKSAVRATLAEWTGELIWQPAAGDVAQSGDLGYTYGVAEYHGSGKPAESSSYLRIWKKPPDGQWLVVLDITNPHSAESAGEQLEASRNLAVI